MTLKQLRISKGMNQAECAEFLGMSTRSYQNYENDAERANTTKYHVIYKKLANYQKEVATMFSPALLTEFHTNVVTGIGLQAFSKRVAKYKKRDCYKTLKKFMDADCDGKICILNGICGCLVEAVGLLICFFHLFSS